MKILDLLFSYVDNKGHWAFISVKMLWVSKTVLKLPFIMLIIYNNFNFQAWLNISNSNTDGTCQSTYLIWDICECPAVLMTILTSVNGFGAMKSSNKKNSAQIVTWHT